MDEKSPELQKLMKIKNQIESDLEKKGKLRKKTTAEDGSKSRISISDEVKKRMEEKRNLSLPIDSVFILRDLDESHANSSDTDLSQFLRTNKERLSNPLRKQNIEGLIFLLEKRIPKALDLYQSAAQHHTSDFITYNYLEALLFSHKLDQNLISKFYKDFPNSPYPFLLVLEYMAYHFSSAESIRKWMEIFRKLSDTELDQVLCHMWNFRLSDAYTMSLAQYRKNIYKEFHTISMAAANLLNPDLGTTQFVSDALKKRSDYRCTMIYHEFYTMEPSRHTDLLAKCPFGIYVLCKRFAAEKNLRKLTTLGVKLREMHEPYGFILTGAALLNQGSRDQAIKEWFELLKAFGTLFVMVFSGPKKPFKGLGLGRREKNANIIRYEGAIELESFSQFIDPIIDRFGDFEILLYPFEEFRSCFGHRKCARIYDFSGIMEGGE